MPTSSIFEKNLFVSILLWLATVLPCAAQTGSPMVKMEVEQLPSLQIPRIGHAVFCVNGEVVVAGGHTTGFVPTATAEYFSGGEWHLIPMTYSHDQGVAAVTETGEVLLVGGHEKELGIGQTFTVELYDPVTHSFRGYGCLDKKRCFSNALPLDSGRIVISGNWYEDDGIELYDGTRQNTFVKNMAQHRSLPHIIRTSSDNAIVFSSRDHHAEDFDTIIVDRLKGEPFTVPLFETWRPLCYPIGYHGSCFIGDEKKGEYVSLIQVMRGDSLMAIARVEGEEFSLLPTTTPIPMRSQWGHILWFSHIIADRRANKAYIVGYGEDYGDHRFYVAAIDYQQTPAPITLLYSEPQDSIGRYQPVLTDDGNLLMAGGMTGTNNNFDASSTVLLLRVNGDKGAESGGLLVGSWASWILPFLILIVIAIAGMLWYRRAKANTARHKKTDEAENENDNDNSDYDELIVLICGLMEQEQLFLDSNLKVSDVAQRLGLRSRMVSDCIRQKRGCLFVQFVNAYRVAYAQQLLRNYPDIKMAAVWTGSGFSHEASFFRTFKSITGMTPKEWKAQFD